MPDPIWYGLRQSRADPPGQARSDPVRRRNYVSALHQFDELFAAARVATAATRPLLVFYGLSQAGRAIVAANGATVDYGKHGLTIGSVSRDITRIMITPKPGGAFRAVCDAIGAPKLTQSVELGAVWGALPDLWGTRLHRAPRWSRALPVEAVDPDIPGFAGLMSVDAEAIVTLDARPSKRTLPKTLANYPTSAGWFLPGPTGTPVAARETEWGFDLRLKWQASGARRRDRLARLDEVAPEYRFHEERWLRPAVGGTALPPLMSWWLLLFGLSILGRYHPAEWSTALDLNRSALAVPLDDALELSLEAVPQLVYEAIRRRPILLRR